MDKNKIIYFNFINFIKRLRLLILYFLNKQFFN